VRGFYTGCRGYCGGKRGWEKKKNSKNQKNSKNSKNMKW
jgi:hypothetical protein